MIHNVDSYTSNITGQEHNLKNCVHKHSEKMLDGGIELKNAEQAAAQKIEEAKMSPLEYLSISIKKALENGLGFLRGIWSESADTGEKDEMTGTVKGEEIQHGKNKTEKTDVVNLAAMESR